MRVQSQENGNVIKLIVESEYLKMGFPFPTLLLV